MGSTTRMGMNRTGIEMSPLMSREMTHGIKYPLDNAPMPAGIAALKHDYEQSADSIGSVPIPGTFRGALVSLKDKLTGKNPEVLINKIGERLAFERTGVRLYDAMIAKCEARAIGQIGAIFTIDELQHFRTEEAEHFSMLVDVMMSVGADPTAQTPDADIAAVSSMGILKVITDPRTSVAQSLQALLAAELVDGCGWELLITICDDFGMLDEADRFRQALRQENDHLATVKRWHEALVTFESGAMP